MKKDYPELSKKPVKYSTSGGEQYNGIVAEVNYDIGITIQEKGTNDKLCCLAGPSSPEFDFSYPEAVTDYTAEFYLVTGMIIAGTYRAGNLNEKCHGGAVNVACPYTGV
ncbi:MAG: hypothetical protein GY799_20980 [Desulfobulbaceae bacterium]|nr:hypothetical protein [Desulfobulbaceae bacterium]